MRIDGKFRFFSGKVLPSKVVTVFAYSKRQRLRFFKETRYGEGLPSKVYEDGLSNNRNPHLTIHSTLYDT
jgi:hypothetical protein